MPNEAAVAVTTRPSAAVPDGHKTSEARRQYLRAYYRRNLERSRQYQREYNLRHKKKQPTSSPETTVARTVRKISVHASDIMHAAPEKAARIIDQVVRGDRQLVAVARQKIS